jgi:demethylmenaquinone methyltransferase/2-methoxy-6-polyprenyl-1,4-benzoquinol methylase
VSHYFEYYFSMSILEITRVVLLGFEIFFVMMAYNLQDSIDMDKNNPSKTHFGYQDVDWDQKQAKVNEVFHSVAHKYDLMNDLMSMGLHRYWKERALQKLLLRQGMAVLDLAGGTGDLTKRIAKKIGNTGKLVLADINESMLQEGLRRLDDAGLFQVECVTANAEVLPFPDGHFDAVIIGFGLRNVRDQNAALREIYRVLKKEGRALILEFSRPVGFLQKPYDWYSFKVLPRLGQLVAQDAESYRYLAESIRKHPEQEVLKDMMQEAGFADVSYENLTGEGTANVKGSPASALLK